MARDQETELRLAQPHRNRPFESAFAAAGSALAGDDKHMAKTSFVGTREKAKQQVVGFALSQAMQIDAAIDGQAAASQFVELAVSGLRSLNDYGRVLNFLAGLPPVSTVTISHVRADAVVYQLQTKATRDQLRQSIDLGRVLVPADVEASGSVLGPMAPLAYRLNR